MKKYHYLKLFIRDHGITHWLFIKQQIKQQYNPYNFLKYTGCKSYYEFERSMIAWDNYYSPHANSI